MSISNNILDNKSNFPGFESAFDVRGFKNPCSGPCFYKPTFYFGGIDFEALVTALNGSKYGSWNDDEVFDYEKYLTNKIRKVAVSESTLDGTINWPVSTNIKYSSQNSVETQTNFRGRLNTVKCCIDAVPISSISISPENCHYSIQYAFRGEKQQVLELMRDTGEIHPSSDDRMKYLAIDIYSTNAEHTVAFLEKSNRKKEADLFKTSVIDAFDKKLVAARSDLGDLNLLYEKVPAFVVKALAMMNDGEDRLFHDLELLLDHDDKGRWSSYRDSSNAVINLLKGFPTPISLYSRLFANPKLIKRVYDDLDGSATNNELITNRTAFCSFLTTLCESVDPQNLIFSSNAFRINSRFRLDSNLDMSNDEFDDKIFLTQQQDDPGNNLVVPKIRGDLADMYAIDIPLEELPPRTTLPEPKQTYFHPLTMVRMIDSRQKIDRYVPAIFVKDISDSNEQDQINKRLRVGIDIAIAVFSLTVLIATPGGWFRFLALDGALALGDAAITEAEDEIAQLEGGKEFLKTWHTLYDSYLTAQGAAIARSLLLNVGPKLLTAVKNVSSRDFLKMVIIKVAIELKISNFGGTILKAAEPTELVAYMKLYEAERLQKAGVAFIYRFDGAKTGYAIVDSVDGSNELLIIYKDLAIFKGDPESIPKSILDAAKKVGPELEKVLEEIYKRTPKSVNGFWEAYNQFGTRFKWQDKLFGKNYNLINDIKNAKMSSDSATNFEGLVAEEFSQYEQVTDITNKVIDANTGEVRGDFDAATPTYLIEAKSTLEYNTIDAGSAKTRFLDQFRKYLDPTYKYYINLFNKKVVLIIGKADPRTMAHPNLKILKSKGLIIIEGIENIKNLY